MRHLLPIAVLALALLAAAPADAQLRSAIPSGNAPVAVYDQPASASGLGQLFNSDNFRVSHSYEFSYGNVAGDGIGLGMYTTSLRFQPSDRLAARVDVGVAHSPFGSSALQQSLGFSQDQPARVFLREATIAYRPTENSVITFSMSQSPFGSYYSPFGMSPFGGGFGPGGGMSARYAPGDFDSMFWRSPSP